ncbi:stalk domain-containing protein [Paenibacillus oryzisoli]|uniref:Copper amine oxidase-like N-terminal domain-containing protein n=1 Tax=Paenibacillus oryzisoli TaxID=1850517 RepID=A0A198AIR3_9BACL|nr:hypothetical protein [Paenibacillus oryzisoli]OAS21127.1 hypothetical protein A8708_30010 [Paenibacillus oryzisoli]
MRQYKMLFVGLITGAILATAGTSFAESAITEVKAFLRPDFTVQVDGNKAELENTPLIYEGSSYLPVRELAGLLGKEVDFNNGTIVLREKTVNSADWISLRDYAAMNNLKVSTVPDTNNTVFSASINSVTLFTFEGSKATNGNSFTATTPKGDVIKMTNVNGDSLLNISDLTKLDILYVK